MANVPEKSTGGPARIAKRKPPRAALERAEDGSLDVRPEGSWDRIMQAADNLHVTGGLVWQAALLGSEDNRTDAAATDFVLGFVDSMRPEDPAEMLLLAQMAATHQAVMMLARHLNHVDTIAQKDCAEKALNKTARTFTAQMDTLKRYRSKGQQTVRVERVTVNEGGQAIVGNVHHGGRGDGEK